MKVFILIMSTILISFSSFASADKYLCEDLIDGNLNGESNYPTEYIKFELIIKSNDSVLMNGLMSDHSETDMFWASLYQSEGTFVEEDGHIKVDTYVNNGLLMCKLSDSPCRKWADFEFDFETLIGSYRYKSSDRLLFGSGTVYTSIVFSCKEI